MKLCLKCCENVTKFDGERWRVDVCSVTGVRIEDVDKGWEEGTDPMLACDTYRGPIGFDFDEWCRRFDTALSSGLGHALDNGSVRPSEVVRSLCK